MKKILILIFIIAIVSQFIMGCSSNKSVQFKEFYSEVIGFSDKDEKLKPIPQDSILMMNNKDFENFKGKYFTQREIKIKTPSIEKAVLFLQIPSSSYGVNMYTVQSINVSRDNLIVNLEQTKTTQVEGNGTFEDNWKWVMLIEVDKSNLKDNMKIVVKNIRDDKVVNRKMDIGEVVWEQLNPQEKELIPDKGVNAEVTRMRLAENIGKIDNKTYIGKEVYLVDFHTKNYSIPNEIAVYASIDNYKLIGHAFVD